MKSVDKDRHLPPIGVMRLLNQLAIGKVDGDFFSWMAYRRAKSDHTNSRAVFYACQAIRVAKPVSQILQVETGITRRSREGLRSYTFVPFMKLLANK